MMVADVIPILDMAPHYLGLDCHCRPLLKGKVIVHNSFDLREAWEKETGEGVPGKRWGTYKGTPGNYALESYDGASFNIAP